MNHSHVYSVMDFLVLLYGNVFDTNILSGRCSCLQKFREMFKLGAQKVGYCALDHLCTLTLSC